MEQSCLLGRVREAAAQLGLEVLGPPLDDDFTAQAYENVIAAMAAQGAGAILVATEAEHAGQYATIITGAARFRLPTQYPFKNAVEAAGCVRMARTFRRLDVNVLDRSSWCSVAGPLRTCRSGKLTSLSLH